MGVPSPLTDPRIVQEWELGRDAVYDFTKDPRVLELPLETFDVREVEAVGLTSTGRPYFHCGGVPAVGCYHSGGHRIEWLELQVLRHEFGHGLWEVLRLHTPGCNWHDWQHKEGCG